MRERERECWIDAVVQRLLRNHNETVCHAVFKLNNNGMRERERERVCVCVRV